MTEKDIIKITGTLNYVGRGALKLLEAIKKFNINIEKKICMDIGASTGGFTQVLLENKAKKVYAVDVGTMQLHNKIRNNKNVVIMENTNARNLILNEKVDIITCDVSFISIKKMIDTFNNNLKKNGKIIALIKPQFEVGRENIIKGIAKDKNIHVKMINEIIEYFSKNNIFASKLIKSPIKGGSGNTEYLILFTKTKSSNDKLKIKKVVFGEKK
ncbi:TlyA family rRNA (cytidine-2'-O)-methyltransferase [Tepiditoga spiralis]|uniref:TlyA family rRNA (Cytidine-2'-O)-methyltransferase n=1 Tax=Tepiditoga spiralis TaxID=2108365 RepID=A0A7G1G4I7_9BACT|nr:TlyA family rRNA (cytidine-2'-O)-methyltransferase [Tepiditoga spiralis]